MTLQHHENISRHDTVEHSTDRNFGLVVGGICALIGGVQLLYGHKWWLFWLAVAAVLLGSALLQPALLRPANRVWTKLGLFLSKVVSPIVLCLLFYACIAPIGLLARASGKDFLRLRKKTDAQSYWIARTPPGPTGENMKHQY